MRTLKHLVTGFVVAMLATSGLPRTPAVRLFGVIVFFGVPIYAAVRDVEGDLRKMRRLPGAPGPG